MTPAPTPTFPRWGRETCSETPLVKKNPGARLKADAPGRFQIFLCLQFYLMVLIVF